MYKTLLTHTIIIVMLQGFASGASAHEAAKKADGNSVKKTPVKAEEVKVWGEVRTSAAASYTNPTSLLTQEDMVSINVATTEDLVKYEPSIVIRRRYIGDSNGTLGLRGSNMFATSRSMVFADGVPLHYFLQSRWSGAPRWTMVSASEIAQVEILYGPFSAEYSGNAMGGVVLIETAIPQERQVHLDLDYFAQDFSAYGFNDQLSGFKTFISYGDKIGDVSLYISFNHLTNDSQPQSYYYDKRTPAANAVAVAGALKDADIYGNNVSYFGDTGIEQAVTDNFKIKVGYDFGDWTSLINIAYEDRTTERLTANSYLRTANGESLWSGDAVQNGEGINVVPSRLNASELTRKSLSSGFRLKGDLNASARFEANLSDFRILKDTTLTSSHNLADPAFKNAGQVTDYGDTGWQTVEGKLIFSNLALAGAELIAGARYEAYQLNVDVFNATNWRAADNAGYSSRSGGDTHIGAAFAQFNWDINTRWNLALGGRYEQWESHSGYFSADKTATPEFDLVQVADAQHSQFSPKFSLGFVPQVSWLLRYSLARAYRFPIVEELFMQSSAYNSTSVATPDLKPENGLHHNMMLEKQMDGGYARINVFAETIQDAIESQSTILPGGSSLTTFSAIDEVETQGVELVLNRYGILVPPLDIRFNIAYTKSTIADNGSAEGANPASSVEGNDFPRMPRWRSNIMLTYHMSDTWDISGNLQYADKSFGRLDNKDTAEQVMGAQDGYTRLGVKTTYQLNDQFKLGMGLDNLTNDVSYVAHPWPGRTLYLNLAYDL